MVEDGLGYLLLPLPTWYFAISAASLVERADEPENIWIDWMPSIEVPLLMFYGDAEVDDVPIWHAGYTRSPSTSKRLVVLPGADHSYLGSEELVCEEAARFVNDVTTAEGVL